MPEWHTIRAKPNAEARVFIGLMAARLEACMPVEMLRTTHRGEQGLTWRPLFPRYLFARFDPSIDLARVNALDGITNVLRPGGHFAPIPEAAILALQQAQLAGIFDRTITHTAALRHGDTVRITEGPFAGLIARVAAAKAKYRITILLDKIHKLSVPIDKLQRLGE